MIAPPRTQWDIAKRRLWPAISVDSYETDMPEYDDRAKVLFVEFDWLGIYLGFTVEITRPKVTR